MAVPQPVLGPIGAVPIKKNCADFEHLLARVLYGVTLSKAADRGLVHKRVADSNLAVALGDTTDFVREAVECTAKRQVLVDLVFDGCRQLARLRALCERVDWPGTFVQEEREVCLDNLACVERVVKDLGLQAKFQTLLDRERLTVTVDCGEVSDSEDEDSDDEGDDEAAKLRAKKLEQRRSLSAISAVCKAAVALRRSVQESEATVHDLADLRECQEHVASCLRTLDLPRDLVEDCVMRLNLDLDLESVDNEGGNHVAVMTMFPQVSAAAVGPCSPMPALKAPGARQRQRKCQATTAPRALKETLREKLPDHKVDSREEAEEEEEDIDDKKIVCRDDSPDIRYPEPSSDGRAGQSRRWKGSANMFDVVTCGINWVGGKGEAVQSAVAQIGHRLKEVDAEAVMSLLCGGGWDAEPSKSSRRPPSDVDEAPRAVIASASASKALSLNWFDWVSVALAGWNSERVDDSRAAVPIVRPLE